MTSIPKLFISSTRGDLDAYRAAVREAAERAGFLVLGMETWAASGEYPWDVCRQYVAEADLVLALVAHRYGSSPPGETKSYTRLECEHARELIAFLVSDKANWPFEHREESRFAAAVQSGDFSSVTAAVKGLSDFKAWLRQRHCGQFATPDELGKLATQALYEWRQKNPRFGAPPAGDPTLYLNHVRALCAYIDIEKLHVSDGRKLQFEIDKLYIPLTTTGHSRELDRREVPLQKALEEPRLLVVGDPGAGKTTFLRRVAYALTSADTARFLEFKERPFPILLRASELTGCDDIPRFLEDYCRKFSLGLTADFFRQKLAEGPCLLMIDSIDEAPDEAERRRLTAVIRNAAATLPRTRIVLTTRPQTIDAIAGFQTVEIGGLADDAVTAFLEEWSKALYHEDAARAKTFREELQRAITSRVEIRRLARNPVMLTALAVLQANNRRLPEERVGLYESILMWLAQSREEKQGRVRAERCLELLQKIALAMQTHPGGLKLQVGVGWAADGIQDEFPRRPEALKFLETEQTDSGIIVSRAGELRFWHRSFQEYLAAREMAGLRDPFQHLTAANIYRAEWREMMRLFAGVLRRQGKEKVDELFSRVLDLSADKDLPEQARCAGLLGAMMLDLKQMDFTPSDGRYLQVTRAMRRIFDSKEAKKIDLDVRIAAAEALGQVGDPRLEEEDNWVLIPAGSFEMGSNDGDADERPVHEVYLDAYRIGRYPVTVQEFARFIEEGGYQAEEYWTEGGFGERTEPLEWPEQLQHFNHPVRYVTWYEAAAYCKWAGCRLPTEAEWERAALGAASAPNKLTPIGMFPPSSSGVYDIRGYLWQWCADWYGGYPQAPQKNPRGPKNGEFRVLRGSNSRVSGRVRGLPGFDFDFDIGFRCVREVIP